MKKAQVKQVFTYIMVILVVGLILILGTRAISNIINKACEVNEATFKTNIENTIKRYNNFGSLGYESIKTPCPEYQEVCFMTSNLKVNECADAITNNPLIQTECETQTGHNVFLKKDTMIIPITIKNIEAQNNFFCIQSQGGEFPIKLEGRARTILISPDAP